MAEADERSAPPGPGLRDPAYQSLCGFYATFPDGQAWTPRLGDWVVLPPSTEPLLVLRYDAEEKKVYLTEGPDPVERTNCVWLPTLDQLRARIMEHFGTTGFFSSNFKDSTYWYTGQMLGMTVTGMQPLAEGTSPEEAALKALLMRHQW
ncbi:MAG TPA: hypothetical protein VN837_10425 [Chloroflexota bacterium]|nr:hypothetical protein [Chloroflexota bacterium]